MTVSYLSVETTVGRLWVAYDRGRVCFTRLSADEQAFRAQCERRLRTRVLPDEDASVRRAVESRLENDTALLFDLESCTPFQEAVLAKTAAIPRGEVRTYAQLAAAVGRPKAARAVGQVMRTNPIPVLIPCHRVVRSTGALGNYSPRPELKHQLLLWEGALQA